jgi:hypothetical protein
MNQIVLAELRFMKCIPDRIPIKKKIWKKKIEKERIKK